jgi:hypothetical protein
MGTFPASSASCAVNEIAAGQDFVHGDRRKLKNGGASVSTDDPERLARADVGNQGAFNCCVNCCGAKRRRMADAPPIFGCIFANTTLPSKRG